MRCLSCIFSKPRGVNTGLGLPDRDCDAAMLGFLILPWPPIAHHVRPAHVFVPDGRRARFTTPRTSDTNVWAALPIRVHSDLEVGAPPAFE